MSSWQNIADILTEEGKVKLKVGQSLTFNYEGSLHHYKIMRMPANGNVWVRQIHLINPENHYGHNIDATDDAIRQYGAPYCTDCEVPVDQNNVVPNKM